MGKTSKRRPCLIPRKLEEKRWELALGHISFKKYKEWYKKWKQNQ